MERCKVICHMYTSIDGKIDGDYMDEEGCDASGVFYDEYIFKTGIANGNGRVTAHMYFANEEIDYSQYQGIEMERKDHVLLHENYWVVFDRFGKCNWKRNEVEYGGKHAHVVEVVTNQVSDAFLAHLQKEGISYIICGEKDLDLKLVLEKLKQLFHIETLVLTGGAHINGGFFKEGLIDEISLVIAPYVEGNHDQLGFIETSQFYNRPYIFKEALPLEDGGVQLLFVKK